MAMLDKDAAAGQSQTPIIVGLTPLARVPKRSSTAPLPRRSRSRSRSHSRSTSIPKMDASFRPSPRPATKTSPSPKSTKLVPGVLRRLSLPLAPLASGRVSPPALPHTHVLVHIDKAGVLYLLTPRGSRAPGRALPGLPPLTPASRKADVARTVAALGALRILDIEDEHRDRYPRGSYARAGLARLPPAVTVRQISGRAPTYPLSAERAVTFHRVRAVPTRIFLDNVRACCTRVVHVEYDPRMDQVRPPEVCAGATVGRPRLQTAYDEVVFIFTPTPTPATTPTSSPGETFEWSHPAPETGMLHGLVHYLATHSGTKYTLVGVKAIPHHLLNAPPHRPREKHVLDAVRRRIDPGVAVPAHATITFSSHEAYRALVGAEQYAIETDQNAAIDEGGE